MPIQPTGDLMSAGTGTALVARLGDQALAGPLGSLDAYLERVSRIAVLSREQEHELAERFRSAGDLSQGGKVGLMKAVKRCDPSLNVRLVSFAVRWIRAEIHEYVLRNWRLVKIATTKAQRKLFFNLRRLKKNLAWLSEAETAAVARDLGVDVADVREMEQRLSARDMSFDPTPESDEEEAYSPAMYLPASN